MLPAVYWGTTSGNSEPALNKLLKPGQVLTGALATPSTVVWAPEVPPVPQWNWTQPVVRSTSNLDQVTSLLFYLGLGRAPGGEYLQWNWWDLNLGFLVSS